MSHDHSQAGLEEAPAGARDSKARRPELIAELRGLRRRVAELEAAESERAYAAECACEQRYRALYEQIPVMFFTLRVDGTIRTVNSYGAEQLGYLPEELVGRPVLEVFHPEDRRAVCEQLQDAVARPGTVARWRFRKIRKDGTMIWVREAVRIVEQAGRRIVLVVCEDVTEQVEAEGKLARYQGQLRALSAELTLAEARECRRIAAGLHDHTGQALVAARLRLGALQEAEQDGDKRRALGEIHGLLEQTLRQTRSLTFELSCPVLYRLGLAAALRDLGEALGRQNGVRFHFAELAPRWDSGDSRPAPLADDQRVLLYRAVRELMLNVVKHAGADNLRVSVRRSAGRLLIAVEDDGVGIDPSRIRPGPTAGGGFGLFAIRERLHHLGGNLEIGAAPAGGTRASITVPLESRPDMAQDAGPEARISRASAPPVEIRQPSRAQEVPG